MASLSQSENSRTIFWFPNQRTRRASGVKGRSIIGPCDPWHVLANASEVWTAPDDELALLAAIAEVPQRLFDERGVMLPAGPTQGIDPADRLAALFGGAVCRDPFSGAAVAPSSFIETLGVWRGLIDANRPIGAIYGVAFWKRPSVAPLIWNGGKPSFRNTARVRRAPSENPAAAAWLARTPETVLRQLRRDDAPLFQIEDGFIRSVGLGADCVPPLSIVVDRHGAHYDPAQASGLEMLLASHDFTPELLERARRLREVIVAQGISKYGRGELPVSREGGVRRHILVTGQVEDDQSVIKGGSGITSNLDLLRRVRIMEPDAFILYRPHPDVDAGHRKGNIDDNVALTIADSIARDVAITSLIDAVDHVHVLTSLAGFEALIRHKPVTTHGVPFYAGWGLTEDLGKVPSRRHRTRSLDELVAATLLLYPRYLDPVTGLPCTPEILIERIASGYRKQNRALVFARQRLGLLSRLMRKLPVHRT